MSPGALRRATLLALTPPAAAVVPALSACGGGSGSAECACGDDGVTIDLPPDRASQVAGVQLAGTACQGVTPSCSEPISSGCAQYTFYAVAAGTCDVDVLFASGPSDFHAEVSFARVACCPGYWPQPPAAAHLEVPDLAADAGGAQ
jgi:hypothetical protein